MEYDWKHTYYLYFPVVLLCGVCLKAMLYEHS